MSRIIDLSMPIADHFRWPVERRVRGDQSKGDVFQATWIGVTVHGFTHMDSPRHCVAGGPTTDDVPLEQTIGEAAVFDLEPVQPNEAITPERLAEAGKLLRPGDIVVMRSCWEQQRSPRTEAFWTDAPYLTREAAEWLLARQPRAVAFDFPQDYPIRLLLKGETRPLAEQVTHDVLLRAGVHMVEYVANTADIREASVFLSAAPLRAAA